MRKLIFLFLFISAFIIGMKAADVSFKANAPQAVIMGQNFNLSYTVNAEGKDLRIPELSDFEVLIGPSTMTSSSTQIINGKMSSELSYTYTYVLRPKKEGTFNVPPATIKVKGATYTSNALAIKVLPQDKADEATDQNGANSGAPSIKSDDIFLSINVSKRNVYEQEGILVTFKLYANLRKMDVANINDLKLPEFEGCLVQDISLPQNKQFTLENYNGKNLGVVTIKEAIVYPQRTGKITIPSGKLDIALRVAGAQKRPRSVFDIFDDGGYMDVNRILTSNPVTIQVNPLPSGKPASFGGAVGNYSMTSSISSDNIKTDEAVTLKLTISGNGNIKLLKNPDVQFPNDFEVYDPKVDNNIQATQSGVTGTKTIEYMAIPRFAGDFEIPAVSFSYFDLKSGSYKTLSTPVYKLHVEQGKNTGSSQVVSNFSNKENVKFVGKDIRYIKTGALKFVPDNEIFFGSFLYYLCYIIPAILFIVFFIIYRKQIKENSDLALVRTKKANKMALRRLKNASKLLKENKKEAFYEEIIRALWGYLSDKLNIPQVDLTKDNVENELKKYGVNEELIKEFMDILNTCEFARYAPAQASDAMDKLYETTEDAISKMENTIKK